MWMRSIRIAALLLFTLANGPAVAADQLSPLVISASIAADESCTVPGVLARIQHRFAFAERTLWHRGFVIDRIDNPRPSGHPYAEPGLVHRDFCVADSVMTNGSAYPVYYAIEQGLGFAGLGRNVDFCVLGLDPWHVHDGDCRTVR
jgi:hypothetical protein